jgi:hypothetical protein
MSSTCSDYAAGRASIVVGGLVNSTYLTEVEQLYGFNSDPFFFPKKVQGPDVKLSGSEKRRKYSLFSYN